MLRFERAFVWLGGAFFVASLLVCAYAFAITWADERPFDPRGWPIAADLALFVLFAAHHSLFARAGAKALMTRLVPETLIRSLYVWIASALLVAVVVLWQPVGGMLYRVDRWGAVILAFVQLAGVLLSAASVRAIDALELAGIRAHDPQGLQIAGPYRIVRHPLYLGWILIVFGAASMTGDRFLFAVVSSLYLIVAIPWEERSLEAAFGEGYRRYMQQVKWRVLPFVY
jgi:protein-S-isoprenylcysteine O-methyltransferase Ste14